ncbi:ribosomal protein L11 methylase PrmA [Nocardioides cavernae]|uniref:Ribosomal protein L11 methylase PrmA n=1 Tax=Nocardioides cavernae TaxID=1921566 RepID=A0A7Y9H152_9ACTN|nr:50S ribosomal protein L11 methyltransferase [Nocardioides cavernae]NYE36066.1 ribosomal protein L11 methylase PrmA [Nocardioides cavernae]
MTSTDHVPISRTEWREWYALGQQLTALDGVHSPSRFSALLAATMVDVEGLTVIDAGSGAGLITIAALAAGAEQVIAIDNDPAAARATADNVASVMGREGSRRLATQVLDFTSLGEVPADLLAVNPPQRPTRILQAVEPDQRHLHEGGGEDGLATLRLVMEHARTRVVRTTAADVLSVGTARRDSERWSEPRLVRREELPMHASWVTLTGALGHVAVWDFQAREAG